MFHFDIGIPTFSDFDEDGFLGVQADVYGDGSAPTGCPSGELQMAGGTIYRPLDPTVGPDGEIDPAQSGQMLYWWDGGRMHCIPTQDPRIIPLLPQIQKGEHVTFGPKGNFTRHHADGRISHFVPDKLTPDGISVTDTRGPNGFERAFGGGSERWDLQGYHLVTKSGGRLDIGPGGMPAPFGKSAATLAADVVDIAGGLVSLGNSSLPQDKLALSTALLAYLAASQSALAAMSALAALLGVGVIQATGLFAQPATGAAVTAFTNAVTAANNLALGLAAALPAQSVTGA